MLIKKSNYNLHQKLILNKKNNNSENYPALFLDRDGVIIKDKNYINSPLDIEIEIGIQNLLVKAHKNRWKIIVITNQSGISRGYFGWEEYMNVTLKMIQELNKNNINDSNRFIIDAIYANGSKPEASTSWRKPNPGMIMEAKNDFNINLQKSIIVGDRLSDLKAGFNSKIKTLIHVKTGHGIKEFELIKRYFCIKNEPYTNRPVLIHNDNFDHKLFFLENLSQFPYSLIR